MNKSIIIHNYYESRLGKFDSDADILDWESSESQLLRFQALTKNINLDHKKLLDIGSGLGSLFNYLQKLSIQFDYSGVDLSEIFVRMSQNKYPQGKFICVDLFKDNSFPHKSFDVVYASGIFNLNLGNNQAFLSCALEQMIGLAREAIVFNLLHKRSKDQDSQYFYYDPEIVRVWVHDWELDIKSVKIIDDYLENDFTVIMEVS